MKKRFFALALLLTGLMSCNSDEELVKANTDYAEPGTAVIIPNFYSVKTPATKADPERTAAFDDEKEIKSIAFFVKVGEDTNLQLFQSTKTTGTVDGLLEQLKETTGVGNYTAKFKMKMNGNQKVIMFALANFAENNLDLSAIATETDLKAAMSNAIVDKKNPEKPLLMLGSLEKNDLKEGEVAEVSFKMDRLVARVDIVNEAYNTDAAKGFRLVSAQVLNAKSQSSLLPDQTSVTDGIAVLDEMEKKDKVVDIMEDVTVVGQRLDTLYMYENTNTANATAIQINGTFNGTPVAQRVEFLREDPATGNKEQLAIGRNNLYTIKIHPSQDSTTVSFKIEVEDWTNAEGDTMTIEPKKVKPVLSEIAGEATAATATGKRIDIDVANVSTLNGTLTFTAEGNQDSKVVVEYVGRKGAAWLNNAVTQGELEGFTKASPILKRTYTIDLSNAKEELENHATVPSDALILVQNANAASICDTIRVCFRPDYNGIPGAKPVLMQGYDGKEYFWAPINVGAENTTNVAATSGDITTACGQLFQWGRYSGVAAAKPADGDIYEEGDRPVGVEDALPNMTKWDGKHIKSSASNPNTRNNWLLFKEGEDNPPSMVAGAWYQRLWNGNEGQSGVVSKTVNDPCPQGWRVPTLDEWKAIGAGKPQADSGTSWNPDNLRLIVPGKEEGETLYLPAAGYRGISSGASFDQGIYGYYWSSSVPTVSTRASNVNFSSGGTLNANTNDRASGFSVRCVQE